MVLTKILLRSYKSFNYDYKLKYKHESADYPDCKAPYEDEIDFDSWRPWVNIPVRSPIACIVGANESGKSHLVSSVYKVLSLEPARRDDICRYSVDMELGTKGDFIVGLQFENLSSELQDFLHTLTPKKETLPTESASNDTDETLNAAINSDSQATTKAPTINSILIISRSNRSFTLHISIDGGLELLEIDCAVENARKIIKFLPAPIIVTPHTKLPLTVSVFDLIRASLEDVNENTRNELLTKNPKLPITQANFNSTPLNPNAALVFSLLKHCGHVDFQFLSEITEQSEAILRQYSDSATDAISQLLNVSHWWGQDVDVKIDFSIRKDQVVLTLTDRTGSWYDFGERSQGFQYFLGFILQILLAIRTRERELLILSDEPDYALSAVGQRDLLRFFIAMTKGDRPESSNQLVYTTHSPELIDPNFPDRVSILRKGLYDEGTVVIQRSQQNLFEPIRSALGTRISAIPFIDGPNLLVEGPSDLRFIVRMSQHLAKLNKKHLDLAELSIVVAEGCNKMARIVSTAISLSGDRAYLTVLLDNDEQGRETKTKIAEIDEYLRDNKQIVSIDDVLGLGINKDLELEDLIPPGLYYDALVRDLKINDLKVKATDLAARDKFIDRAQSIPIVDLAKEFITNAASIAQIYEVDKVEMVEHVFTRFYDEKFDTEESTQFLGNLDKLTGILIERIDDNVSKKKHEEVRKAIGLRVKEFKRANPAQIQKSRAKKLLEIIRNLGLQVSKGGGFELIITQLTNKHKIDEGRQADNVIDHSSFFEDVASIPMRLTLD